MTDLRDTQNPVEIPKQDPGSIRDTQEPVELIKDDTGSILDTQNPVEVFLNYTAPAQRTTQFGVELILKRDTGYTNIFVVT